MRFFNRGGDDKIIESTKAFQNRGQHSTSIKHIESISGEGVDDALFLSLYGRESVGNFNNFYSDFINTTFANKRAKIQAYRNISEMPEISAVLEDIAIESTQEDSDGKILQLRIIDQEMSKNENIVHNLKVEFDELFHRKMNINTNIIDYVRTYFVDSELYLEKIIQTGKQNNGLVGIKKLPTETMDYFLNPKTGRVEWYYQALASDVKLPKTLEDAEKNDKIITFLPEQIAHIDYGVYQGSRKVVMGYLEKAKQPFNQLKLLETSVVIYRIVKSPERLVFSIDTGAMPRDKSLKFVEKIKKNLTQKVEFDQSTGQLRNQTDVMSMMDNYFLPQCLRLSTSIDCLDGDTKTLNSIIDDFNNGIKNEVFSVDQDTGRVIKGEIEWAGITRKNASLVRVYIDNDGYVDCTPDHEFVMYDGSEVQAQHLKSNDVLMPYHTKDRKISPNTNEYNGVYWHSESQKWKDVHPISVNGDVVHRKVVSIEWLDIVEDTGCLTIKDPGNNHNFALSCGVFVKNSSDGRGSSVESIGGNPSGFAELDDIYYFARKLYIALKYPISRVIQAEERQQGETMFMGGSTSDITLDEVRWAKFLDRHQQKFSQMWTEIFLLHLEFKGMKNEYDIDVHKINITMTPPNDYKSQMTQSLLETRMNNYTNLANNPEFSKSFLMKEYLLWDDDKIKENAEGHKKDKSLLPQNDF